MLKKLSLIFIPVLLLFSCGAKIDYSAYTKAYIDCEQGLSELKANIEINQKDTTIKPEEKVAKTNAALTSAIDKLRPRIKSVKAQAELLAKSVDPNAKPSGDDKKANEEILKHKIFIDDTIEQINQLILADEHLSANEAVKSNFSIIADLAKATN